jgi:hypothetical protein
MCAKNKDFYLILTQKGAILAAILDFMGQIIKNDLRNGFLEPKKHNIEGSYT